MKHGCMVAAVAALAAGFGFIPAAMGACHPLNPTACTADSQAKATTPDSQAKAAAPLKLQRFIALGPARRAGVRTVSRRVAVARKTSRTRITRIRQTRITRITQRVDQAPRAPATTDAAETSTEPVTPKAVQTVTIRGVAAASPPANDDRADVVTAATEPQAGHDAFAAAHQPPAWPPGLTVGRFDEVNEIDLAADAEAKGADDGKSDRLTGVSFVTPAHAAQLPQPAQNAPPPDRAKHAAATPDETSWLSWLYGKLVDSVLAAALAIRSIFV